MPNQPLDGLAFSTGGAYGTTLFDPMDGSTLEVNVCDPCLRKASEQRRVLFYGVERVSLDADSFLMRKPNFKLWTIERGFYGSEPTGGVE